MAKIQDIVAQYRLPLDLWVQTPSLDRMKLPVQTAEFHKVDCYRDPDFGASRASPRPLPSGGSALSWVVMAVGAAVAALTAGSAVYNAIDEGVPDKPDPAPNSKVANASELDAAEVQCQAALRSWWGSFSDEHWILALETPGSTQYVLLDRLQRAFQFLRNQGLGCPGFRDLGGRTVVGNGACGILVEFGSLLYLSGLQNKIAVNDWAKGLAGNNHLPYGAAGLTAAERDGLRDRPGDFRNTLRRYFTRICATGALSASAPAASIP